MDKVTELIKLKEKNTTVVPLGKYGLVECILVHDCKTWSTVQSKTEYGFLAHAE